MSYLLLDLRWELTTTPALAEGGEPSIWDTRLQLRVFVMRDSASRLPRVPRTEEHNYVVNSCIKFFFNFMISIMIQLLIPNFLSIFTYKVA